MARKKRKIQRRKKSHDNDESHSDTIPLEMTIEILSRLPATSIVRFRSVSKLWTAITTTPNFINLFATRSSALQPSVLLIVHLGFRLFALSSPLQKNSNNPDGPFPYEGRHHFSSPNVGPFGLLRSIVSVNGLIFLEGLQQLVIWNPTEKRFVTLPEPEGNEGVNYTGGFLGYDPIGGKYKALCITNSKICILTLGAQESWRTIANLGISTHENSIGRGRCINNGVIYYETQDFIISFDVRSEKFNQIEFPEGKNYSLSFHKHMVLYEGRLALVKTKCFPSIDIWILKNGDRKKWRHKRFVLPVSDMDPIQRKELRFNGVNDANELVFAPWSLSKSFSILYFNPRSNSIREALFVGTVGDQFRRCYGLDADGILNMDIFPNHIETLVSFKTSVHRLMLRFVFLCFSF